MRGQIAVLAIVTLLNAIIVVAGVFWRGNPQTATIDCPRPPVEREGVEFRATGGGSSEAVVIDRLVKAVERLEGLLANPRGTKALQQQQKEPVPPSSAQLAATVAANGVVDAALSAKRLTEDDVRRLKELAAQMGVEQREELSRLRTRILAAYNRNELVLPTELQYALP